MAVNPSKGRRKEIEVLVTLCWSFLIASHVLDESKISNKALIMQAQL